MKILFIVGFLIIALAIIFYQLVLKDILSFVIETNDDSTEFKERINKENGS